MDNLFSNGSKKISWVQICFLGCVIILTLCAFFTLANNSAVLVNSSQTIGIPLFITGVICLIICAVKKSALKGSQWLMSDGIATTVLAVFFIVNTTLFSDKNVLLFAFWVIFLGLFKLLESKQLKREKVRSYAGFMYIGIAEILSGAGFLIRFSGQASGYNIAVVIALFIQMSALTLRYFLYPEMTKE